MTTGMRIAKLRTNMGWSQSKLAREMKTNVTTIQNGKVIQAYQVLNI